jgi:hypothetical protein
VGRSPVYFCMSYCMQPGAETPQVLFSPALELRWGGGGVADVTSRVTPTSSVMELTHYEDTNSTTALGISEFISSHQCVRKRTKCSKHFRSMTQVPFFPWG